MGFPGKAVRSQAGLAVRSPTQGLQAAVCVSSARLLALLQQSERLQKERHGCFALGAVGANIWNFMALLGFIQIDSFLGLQKKSYAAGFTAALTVIYDCMHYCTLLTNYL